MLGQVSINLLFAHADSPSKVQSSNPASTSRHGLLVPFFGNFISSEKIYDFLQQSRLQRDKVQTQHDFCSLGGAQVPHSNAARQDTQRAQGGQLMKLPVNKELMKLPSS